MWPELRRKFNHSIRFSPRDTLVTLGILLGVSGLCFALQGFDPQNNFVSMLFVLAVFLIARMTEGYFYGIFSSLVSVLIVNYLFTYPYFHFNFTLAGYPIAILTMLVVSITTSALTSRAKQSARAQLEADREKTRSNLLRAVSHDLRTPLTSILGVSSAILENDDAIGKSERLALLQDVQNDASWLIRMVENLLTITRMDNGGEAKVTKRPRREKKSWRPRRPSFASSIQIFTWYDCAGGFYDDPHGRGADRTGAAQLDGKCGASRSECRPAVGVSYPAG